MNNPLSQQISEEFKLLLACLKYYLGTATKEDLLFFSAQRISKERFIMLVHEHRLVFVLRHCMNELPEAFPEEIRKQINSEHKANVAFMMKLGKEMLLLNRLSEKHGLKITFIKGPVLAERLYGEAFNTRKSRDLDVLIKEDDIKLLDELLLKAGYRLMTSEGKLKPGNNQHWLAYQKKTNHHLVYLSPSNLTIELHWSLTRNPSVDAFSFDKYSMAGQELGVLSSENSALYLAWHGGSHRWKRLFWLLDVAMLIRREKVTEEVFELARQRKINRSLTSACMLVNELLQVELPQHILKEYRQDARAVNDLNKRIINMMYRKDILQQTKLSASSVRQLVKVFRDEKLCGIKLYQTTAEKRKYINALFYSPANYSYIPLPRGLFFLYIPLRPVILLMMWREKLKITRME